MGALHFGRPFLTIEKFSLCFSQRFKTRSYFLREVILIKDILKIYWRISVLHLGCPCLTIDNNWRIRALYFGRPYLTIDNFLIRSAFHQIWFYIEESLCCTWDRRTWVQWVENEKITRSNLSFLPLWLLTTMMMIMPMLVIKWHNDDDNYITW